jgi:hypothetical protein
MDLGSMPGFCNAAPAPESQKSAAANPRVHGELSVLKCREMTELSTDYLEGALPWPAWLAARWHLLLCRACRAYYDQLDKTIRLLRGQELPGPSSRVEADLVAARPAPGGGDD